MDSYPASPEPEPTPAPAAQAPSSVKTAVKLIWIGIGISILSSLLTFFYLDDIVDSAMESAGSGVDRDAAQVGTILGIVLSLVISVALTALFAYFIGKGANWARIVYTVLAVLGLLLSVFGLAGQPALLMILALVSIAITIATLVLLFRPDANRYFSKPRFAS